MSDQILQNKNYQKKRYREKIVEKILLGLTLISILSLVLITAIIVIQGIKPFVGNFYDLNVSLWSFLTGTNWDPSQDIYGIGYMIVGTFLSIIGAIIIAIPMAILTAVLISEFLPNTIKKIMRTVIEILASIPSVIYGIFGLGVIVPLIKEFSPEPYGQSLLAVILVLAIMIIPTIVAVSEAAIKSVPDSYREGARGLGANNIQTVFKIIIPAAKSGIIAGTILGVGRAIGETMAIILVAGNPSGGIPNSVFDMVRPLTANIALEMGYAHGGHQAMLFATALVLFIFIILVNIVVKKFAGGEK